MKTADPELMRAINRFHVLDTIRRYGAISRVEIGDRIQLSPTTVSAITGSLIEDGLILPKHEGDLRGGNRGRPRVMLALNPKAARVVGAKIAATRLAFVVTDFQGDVLAELVLPLRVDRLPLSVIADLVEDGVRRCVLDAGIAMADVKSVAVSLPGIIEHGTGLVRASSIFRDADVPLKEAVVERLGIDVIVESDANAITMGEHWFGQARDCDDFVLVAIEDNLTLGVMHGGQIFRGARELSLTLGDMVMGADPDHAVKLADVASEKAIINGEEINNPRMRDAIRLGSGMSHVRDMIEAGDNKLRVAASNAGAALGIAIANLVALFAPPRVILVGSTLTLGPHLLDALQSSFAKAIPQSLREVAQIVIENADDRLWARGAAAVALGELYGSPWGTTGPARTFNADALEGGKSL
ncbi:ROK family transcriptional regulator [Devosia soli]|uniref:ROK family transcriptional regulator n=1 Tax=Devosia soli TaxID=361041 RepID=A0A0F5L3M5_9HYPH|nr:ROK family transcriptional regulator [Devosia soli]KKB76968.1 ROK family transcriptional regulator [Devosia soli]